MIGALPDRDGETFAVSVRDIVKEYPGVRALAGVSLDLCAGEVHALVGENGAGKSTLIRVLSGDVRPNRGRILVRGEEVDFQSPYDARRCGIVTIFQELTIVPGLSVAENVILGSEPTIGFGRQLYSRRRAERIASNVLQLLGFGTTIDPGGPVASLSTAQKQIIEIARALVLNAPVIILDEPTASLSDTDADALLRLLRKLRAQGTAILYVSHRLDEVRDIADRITVLRGGKHIATMLASAVSGTQQLIELMVGRPIEELFPPRGKPTERVAFAVRGLTRDDAFADVSFEVRAGEILGVAGLIGAGRTEVMRAIFGADPLTRGVILKNGGELTIRTPSDAIAAGIAYLPEDRKEQGLVLSLPGYENLALASLGRYGFFGLVFWGRLRKSAYAVANRLQFRGNLEAPARTISGGNQQKLVIGKWVLSNAQVLIFDEPTRGIDVGAKAEVYRLMHQLARQGAAIIVVSSELRELMNLCHRIIVMSQGRVQDELAAADFDEHRILSAAFAAHVASLSGDQRVMT
jgi:ABC-type sugar transport system ATPase subunit